MMCTCRLDLHTLCVCVCVCVCVCLCVPGAAAAANVCCTFLSLGHVDQYTRRDPVLPQVRLPLSAFPPGVALVVTHTSALTSWPWMLPRPLLTRDISKVTKQTHQPSHHQIHRHTPSHKHTITHQRRPQSRLPALESAHCGLHARSRASCSAPPIAAGG
jgi:hypothetical protein